LSDKIKKLYDSDIYIISVCIFAFFFWHFKINGLGAVIIVAYGFFSLFFCKDIKGAIISIVLCVMSFSDITDNLMTPNTKYYIFFSAIYILIAIFTYFFKNFYLTKTKVKFGSLKTGILIALIVALLGGINYPYNNLYAFRLIGKVAGVYFLYFLCINGLKDDSRRYFCRMFIYACLTVTAEVLVTLNIGDFWQNVFYKHSILGWGVSNNLAVLFLMLIPLSAYQSIDSKIDFIYVFIMFFAAAFVFFLLSKGCMVIAVFSLPVCYIYSLKKTKRKLSYIIAMIITVSLALLLIFAIYNKLDDQIIERFKGDFDSGRFDIYREALAKFRQYPIFGIGLYRDITIPTLANFSNYFWIWHSTVIEIITCFGIVGVIGFIPFYFQRYRLLLKNMSMFKLACLVAVLSFEAYGLIDVMFTNLYLNLFVFMLLGLCETEPVMKFNSILYKN